MYPDSLVGYQNPAPFWGPGMKVVSGRRKRAVEVVVESWKRELGKSVVTVGLSDLWKTGLRVAYTVLKA